YNNRFMFTGREYIKEFGIYEYRARTYHPGLGRFMSEDPKGFDAGDYNLFRYCKNDPEDITDPMGLYGTNGMPNSELVWHIDSHIPDRVPSASTVNVTGKNEGGGGPNPGIDFRGSRSGNINAPGAPARLVEVGRSGDVHLIQAATKDLKPLKGEIASQEFVSPPKTTGHVNVGKSETSERAGFVYQPDGKIRDRVTAPKVGPQANGQVSKDQHYTIWFRAPGQTAGLKYDIPTQFQQIHTFKDGHAISNELRITQPSP
ncbi:MAG: RHS repeat-associated core domain-containing protein, partial [Chthoniobacterales bacterium]